MGLRRLVLFRGLPSALKRRRRDPVRAPAGSHLLEVTQGWVERGHTEEQLSFSYIFVSRLGC